MSDENADFSLRRMMEQGEGGSIGEPYHVQTIFENGKVRLDLPEVAATYYAELVAERDALAQKLERAVDWTDKLSETLQVMNAKHGGRNAARLLKDFRDERAALAAIQETTDD